MKRRRSLNEDGEEPYSVSEFLVELEWDEPPVPSRRDAGHAERLRAGLRAQLDGDLAADLALGLGGRVCRVHAAVRRPEARRRD
jgi:hypothetical protein